MAVPKLIFTILLLSIITVSCSDDDALRKQKLREEATEVESERARLAENEQRDKIQKIWQRILTKTEIINALEGKYSGNNRINGISRQQVNTHLKVTFTKSYTEKMNPEELISLDEAHTYEASLGLRAHMTYEVIGETISATDTCIFNQEQTHINYENFNVELINETCSKLLAISPINSPIAEKDFSLLHIDALSVSIFFKNGTGSRNITLLR